MSKKRSKSTESRNLRAVIDEQLTAAAEEIFWLLKERRQTDVEELKRLVTERITAAVEQIFTEFEATRAAERGPEEPGENLRAEPGADGTDRVRIDLTTGRKRSADPVKRAACCSRAFSRSVWSSSVDLELQSPQ